MDNEILRVRLEAIGSYILFQVLEQSDHIDIDSTFYASNGWEINSRNYPEITTGTIFIRGSDKDEDDRPTLYKTGSSQSAIDVKEDILAALEEYVKRFSPPSETPHSVNVYRFYSHD